MIFMRIYSIAQNQADFPKIEGQSAMAKTLQKRCQRAIQRIYDPKNTDIIALRQEAYKISQH